MRGRARWVGGRGEDRWDRDAQLSWCALEEFWYLQAARAVFGRGRYHGCR